MKPFDIELAKKNHPVQTRDGKPVRILCYDLVSTTGCTIGALIKNDIYEGWNIYYENGKPFPESADDKDLDLVMAPVIKEGWINIYRNCDEQVRIGYAYQSETNALENIGDRNHYICTKKIEWEE